MEVRETGTVVCVAAGRAGVRIRPQRSAACHGCTACQAGGGGRFLLWIDAASLAEGDEVTLLIPVPGPWRAMALVLALPLAALVAGIVIGSEWSGLQRATGLDPGSAGIALGAAMGLATFAGAVIGDRRFARRHGPCVVDVRRPG